jgi:hypothetical protein
MIRSACNDDTDDLARLHRSPLPAVVCGEEAATGDAGGLVEKGHQCLGHVGETVELVRASSWSSESQSAMPDASARCTDRPGSTGGQRRRRALEGRELHELAVETAARTAVVVAVAARLLYVPAS